MKERYQTPLPATWFMQRPGFCRFMLREATCIPLAGYLVFLLVWLHRLGGEGDSFAAFVETCRHPVIVALHVVFLLGALYHSITWFNLTPKIMPLYFAEEKVPDIWTAVFMGYGPWVTVTAAVLWAAIAFGGGS